MVLGTYSRLDSNSGNLGKRQDTYIPKSRLKQVIEEPLAPLSNIKPPTVHMAIDVRAERDQGQLELRPVRMILRLSVEWVERELARGWQRKATYPIVGHDRSPSFITQLEDWQTQVSDGISAPPGRADQEWKRLVVGAVRHASSRGGV